MQLFLSCSISGKTKKKSTPTFTVAGKKVSRVAWARIWDGEYFHPSLLHKGQNYLISIWSYKRFINLINVVNRDPSNKNESTFCIKIPGSNFNCKHAPFTQQFKILNPLPNQGPWEELKWVISIGFWNDHMLQCNNFKRAGKKNLNKGSPCHCS